MSVCREIFSLVNERAIVVSSMVCFERDWEKVDPCRARAYIIDLYDKRLVQKKSTKREEVNQKRRSQPKETKLKETLVSVGG